MECGHYFEKIFSRKYTFCIFTLATIVLVWKICMWRGWVPARPNDLNAWYAIAGLTCVLIWYALGKEREKSRRTKQFITAAMWILVISAFHSVHYDFAKRFLSGHTFRVWAVYHYYLGSKYFDELGYYDLYEQTLVADREGRYRLKDVKTIRDLHTLERKPVTSFALKRSERFSNERWEEFKNDVAFFTSRKGSRFFQELLCDRGYNPSPLWTFIGRSFTRILDIQIAWQRTVLLYLDLIIAAMTLVICIWAFGAGPSAIVILIFVLLPFNTQRLFGGFLTYDWFYAMLLGLALFHKGKGRLSALCWAYSAMTRVFPVIFVLGLLSPIIRDFRKNRSIAALYQRFLGAFAIFCMLGLIFGSFNAYGPKSWAVFGDNIRNHAQHHITGSRRVGMKHLFTQKLFSPTPPKGGYEKGENLENQKIIYTLLQLVMLCGVAFTVFRKRGTDAMLWMMPAFFALVVSSRYYWSVCTCLALLNITDGKRRPSTAGSILPLGIIACWYFYSKKVADPFLRYVFVNGLFTLGFFLMMVWDFVSEKTDRKIIPRATKFTIPAFGSVLVVLTLAFVFMYTYKSDEDPFHRKNVLEKSLATPFAGHITLEEFPILMNNFLNSLEWKKHTGVKRLTREILEESFRKGRQFMISNQKKSGNFNYQYDFVEKEMAKDDHQVRQAGALWGLALMYQYEQTPENKAALEKGLKFFFDHTQEGAVEGALLIAYPGEYTCHTGTVALVALSIIEYLRTEKAENTKIEDKFRRELIAKLNGYIEHLKFLRLKNKHFSSFSFLPIKIKYWSFSPYYDGESIFCLIKAAKYLGYTDLIPLIEDSAMVMAKYYTIDQWRDDTYSDETKGFFQWGCMAFWEYQDARWKNAEVFGDSVLSLAWWMIHIHNTPQRTRNTGYAYEGIIHAYQLAKARKHQAALNDLAYTIDKGLHKLTTWQVGGPLQFRNRFLFDHQTNDPLAIGGVMNHKTEPFLRIDITQHQMHSVIQALKYVYSERPTSVDHPLSD
jgi:UDP-N-acetylmuramoyl-tripeptide--D-alanyl-D-alanine ligase